METVVLVNAAPGYEERVASALQEEDGVAGIAAVQEDNFNMAILLQVDGPNKLQKFLTNTLMFVSGVQGAELDKDPSDDLMERLESDGPSPTKRRSSGGGPGGRGRPSPGPGDAEPGEPTPGPGEPDGPSPPGVGGPPGEDDRDRPKSPDSGGHTPGNRGPGTRTPGGSGPGTGGHAPDNEEDIPGIDETDIPSPGDRDVGGPRDPDPRELRGEKDEDEDE